MKRAILFLSAILFLGAAAQAQEVPRVEISGGFSFLDANLRGSGQSFHLSGGGGSATENVNRWFGGRLQIDAFGGTVSGTNVTAQTFTYGPVVTYRKFERLTPFADLQLGAIHASAGYLGISASAFRFALRAGGGADINLNPKTAIRLQADYLMTRFLSLRQDNLQIATGLVFRFGKR